MHISGPSKDSAIEPGRVLRLSHDDMKRVGPIAIGGEYKVAACSGGIEHDGYGPGLDDAGDGFEGIGSVEIDYRLVAQAMGA